MGKSKELSLTSFKERDSFKEDKPAFLESVQDENKGILVGLGGKFLSMHHPIFYTVEVIISLIVGSTIWWLTNLMGLNISYLLLIIFSLVVIIPIMKYTYYITAQTSLISENMTVSGRIKEDLNKLKKVYLMSDNKVRFVYELIDLQNSTTSVLKYNIEEGAKTLSMVKATGDTALYNAVVQYKNTQVLTDKELLNLVNTYSEILHYDEEKRKSKYFSMFVENKGDLREQPFFLQLEAGNKVIVEDLEQLRLDGASYLEENRKIIERIKEEQLVGK